MDFSALTANQLINGLREKKWTSEELVHFFCKRIKEIDKKYNSIPFLYEKQALAQAKQIDKNRQQGLPIGPLEGLPLTIKDAFRVADQKTTYGLYLYKNHKAKTDSQVIKALKKSGAIIIGRTAVPTACFDWNCKNQIYAECVNPHDKQRTPGGSSGGSAAALSLKLTPLELGSDIGGSIRYPAHCCGVMGFRTSDGWLPSKDWGPEGSKHAFDHFVTCGPMGRSFDDLSIVLDIFNKDFPIPKIKNPSEALSKLNIAFSFGFLDLPCDDDTKICLEKSADLLRASGHTVIEKSPDIDIEEAFETWALIVGYEYIRLMPSFIPSKFLKAKTLGLMILRKLGSPSRGRDMILKGARLKKAEYEKALIKRDELLVKVDEFFSEYDAWFTPVSATPALALSNAGKTVNTHVGPKDYSYFIGSYLVPTALFGTPVLTFPIGKSKKENLPIGVQVHSKRFGDLDLIEMAKKHFSQLVKAD
ncbi:MAG: amidase [Bacteriovoracia bacterium]